MIIDVDSHWEIGLLPVEEHPLGPWLDQLPFGLDLLAFAIAGDVLKSLSEDRRPAPAELLPTMAGAASAGQKAAIHPAHESAATERLTWMDAVGIDHCIVNPGGYWQQIPFLGGERPAAIRRCNDFLCDRLSDGNGRLHAVAVVDWSTPDTAIAELTHARARGARAFFLQTERGRPATGTSPGHPMWDAVWSAAVDLGMIAVIHVGNTEADFTGWAEIGWDQPGGAGGPGLARLANTQRAHAAQNILAGMLYGGAFARHPRLSVVIGELRAGWFPHAVQTLARQAVASPFLGDWPWEESGEEMLHRAVRLTPLPGFGDDDALEILTRLPDMVVFSSDYPHHEGNADPVELYRPQLDHLDAAVRADFLGENIARCFHRTGDPLPAR